METEWTSSTPSHFIAIETGARHCRYMLISKMRETDCLAMKLLDHTCCSILTDVCLVAIEIIHSTCVNIPS